MPPTLKKPAASNIRVIRNRGIRYARTKPSMGIRFTVQSGTSDATVISIPIETPFSRDIFLRLQALPGKMPNVPVPEDANL